MFSTAHVHGIRLTTLFHMKGFYDSFRRMKLKFPLIYCYFTQKKAFSSRAFFFLFDDDINRVLSTKPHLTWKTLLIILKAV